MVMKIGQDKLEWVKQKYLVELEPTTSIALALNVSSPCVINYLKRNGIRIFSIKEKKEHTSNKLRSKILNYLVKRGFTNYSDLCFDLNTSYLTARKHLFSIHMEKEYNLDILFTKELAKFEKIEKVKKLYLTGMSVKEISSSVKLSPITVVKYIREFRQSKPYVTLSGQ